MRLASRAVLLALLIAVAAAIAPAVAPGAPVPAAIAPAVALAADDIGITTATRYVVDPGARRVRVTVDITAVNNKPNRVSGGTVTRYFYDGVNLGLQPEARNLRATQEGAATKVQVAKRKGYRLATVRFRGNIYFGQTARVRLAFDLPGGEPRSSSDVRVGKAFTTFMAWAFGDAGTVRIAVPSSYTVDIRGATLDTRPGEDGLAIWSASTSEPLGWYAWINATDTAALTNDRVALAGGDEILVRGWPEDTRWRSRVRALLRDGVPGLVRDIGLAWPVEGPLSVTEVHTPLLEGYAGFYDPATDRITISEELDELTIIHEASHAWFNTSLFTERWITEGLADEYAARVLRELGRGHPGPDPVKRTAKAAFPLTAWALPAPIRSDEGDARERYGYNASWVAMRGIMRIVSEDGMREVLAAAAGNRTAYRGDAPPERSTMPNDWRRLLDLADELGSGTGVEDLLTTWVLDDGARKLLPVRAEARRAYAALEASGGTWTPPLDVRMAMDRWTFADATAGMATASAILATRDRIVATAAAEGLAAEGGLEADYEAADSLAGLASVQARASESLAVLGEVAAAGDTVAAPRDWLTDLGLDGVDPATAVEAARHAWEAGDVQTARSAAAAAIASLAAAPEAGRTRVITYGVGGAIVSVVATGLILLFVIRRLGAARRRRGWSVGAPGAAWSDGGPSGAMPPDPAAGRPAAGWIPDAPGPYATLPPDGAPGEPVGGPTSGDEGADRS